MIGYKHTIECHCVLQLYKDKVPTVYHRFSVYSKVDDKGNIVPKYSNCNNCGATHLVYEICKSEIKLGKEDINSIRKIEDIKISLPDNIAKVLDDHKCDLSTYELVEDIMDNEIFPYEVILSREIVDEEHNIKILNILSQNKIKISNESIRTIIKMWGRMSYSVKLEKIAKERQESRNIVKQILDYGVSEQQKLDIIFEIALNLENNEALKSVTSAIKSFREKINNDEEDDNISNEGQEKPKLIL